MRKIWQVLALVIVGSIAAQLLLDVLTPFVPLAIGIAVLLGLGSLGYRRLRRW
jgi:hypothetical protein